MEVRDGRNENEGNTHELLNAIKRLVLLIISINKWKEIRARGTENLLNEL